MRKLSWILFLLITSLASAEKWALLVGINNCPDDISNFKCCVAIVIICRRNCWLTLYSTRKLYV